MFSFDEFAGAHSVVRDECKENGRGKFYCMQTDSACKNV